MMQEIVPLKKIIFQYKTAEMQPSSRSRLAARDYIFKLLRSPEIDSASLCSLAGRYDNPIPTRFLAPECSKIPAQQS
jgi:hypothetical protein